MLPDAFYGIFPNSFPIKCLWIATLEYQSSINEIHKISFNCTALKIKFSIKGALPGLRQFLATESPLKMMKNTFYFT